MNLVYIMIFFLNIFAYAEGITTTGECVAGFQADRMRVSIEIKSNDKDAATAFKKVTEDYKKLSDTIKKLNLTDLEVKTTQARLSEDYEWVGNKRVNKGFLGQAGLSVITSDFHSLGKIMSAFKPQNSNIDSQNFFTFTSTAKAKEVYESCLEKAVDNARAKAEKLARASQVKLGLPSTITEGSEPLNHPSQFNRNQSKLMAVESASIATTDLSAEIGREEMSVKVQVTFEIKK